jgi:hypothetical protein
VAFLVMASLGNYGSRFSAPGSSYYEPTAVSAVASRY